MHNQFQIKSKFNSDSMLVQFKLNLNATQLQIEFTVNVNLAAVLPFAVCTVHHVHFATCVLHILGDGHPCMQPADIQALRTVFVRVVAVLMIVALVAS